MDEDILRCLREGLPGDLFGLGPPLAAALEEPGAAGAMAVGDIGGQLINDAQELVRQGRPDEALATARAGLEVLRCAARSDPDGNEVRLGLAHNAVAGVLDELGRWVEGLAAAEEAVVVLRRRLPADGRHVPDDRRVTPLDVWAGVLANLGILLNEVGRSRDAIAAVSEAIAVLRRLDTGASAPDKLAEWLAGALPLALNNLAELLVNAGQGARAVDAAREAVARFRAQPDYAGVLPSALRNLAQALLHAGRVDEALAAAGEALVRCRSLVADQPEWYQGDLPATLVALARVRVAQGDAGAVALVEEAVATARPLVDADPEAYELGLAEALRAVAEIRLTLGDDLPAARSAATEASEIYLRVAESRPPTFAANLRARSLGLLDW